MGVHEHLRIELDEYDRKIRTFVPFYERLLHITANALTLVEAPAPLVVDLGVGTGALAEACLDVRPRARLVGIDTDPDMLAVARTRLSARGGVELRQQSFLDDGLPGADALVACISLHHIRRPDLKQGFYRRAFASLAPGGILVSGDCYPAAEPRLAARHREGWLNHLELAYTRAEAEGHLHAWSGEDTYFPLTAELAWLREAGFTPEVLWREDGFAVVAGIRAG